MKKRILSLLLAAMMILTLMPTAALADTTATSGTCGDNLTWTLDYYGTLTISGTGAMMNYKYEWNYDLEGWVTTAPWRDSYKDITSVVISVGVTTIGSNAFNGCRNLASVTIPNSVTAISWGAFSSCYSLTDVTIPNSVTMIGENAFAGCGLTSVAIPDSVTTINDGTFVDCIALESVTIPDSVTTIDRRAFSCCESLTSVTIPNSVTTIGYEAFMHCSSLTSVTIPNSVTTIDGGAFYCCESLTSVAIPNSVATMGHQAFYGCKSLKNVTIANGVTTIGDGAFKYCKSLTSVTIPNSVTTIEGGAFLACSSLTSVTIPSSVTTIDTSAFGDCSSLADVYYGGTQAQWEKISWKIIDIDEIDSEYSLNATIHYNYHIHNYIVKDTTVTCTSGGYTTYTCSCGDSYRGSYTNSLGHNYSNGVCTRCGEKDPNYVPPKVSFTDVSSEDYCYDAVQWAVANGITKGTGNNTFSPDKSCTRAEVVTFLWRAAGEPSASATVNFTDVKPTDYFYKAVQWAVENKITTGVGNGKFAPDDTCTRSQVVTFLWRANGSPIVSGGGFADVPADAYYVSAVKWAVANGITTGVGGGKFAPDDTCTRGQVVTFLFRAQ